MSFRRRAAAPRLIDWTGERCVPWTEDIQVVYEHFHRYMWAASVVGGREVLDLGSGEGFGAAMLAESAARVIGVEIDERTVEHSRFNYAASNLEFRVGTALDLSDFDDGSFGAVVAFEVIEHVREQEQMLAEVARVLSDDGILLISTPDRRLYSESTGQANPFHLHELTVDELRGLLAEHFPNVACWGQRTIAGSHMHALDDAAPGSTNDAVDFYVERSGEEWRAAGDPAAFYVVAVASRSPLPEVAKSSTLADCGLELMRVKERDAVLAAAERDEAVRGREELSDRLQREVVQHGRELRERDARAHEELLQRDRDIQRGQEDVDELRAEVAARDAEVAARDAELAAAKQLNRRIEESVTWQAFQRVRGGLYRVIGERSVLARALGRSLRLVGKPFMRKSKPAARIEAPDRDGAGIGAVNEHAGAEAGAASEHAGGKPIALPVYDSPKVSLIIPLYSHAELTRACLNSIRDNTTHVSYEVILVDDAADEETKHLLDEVQGAKIVRNEENLGYLRSMNRGADAARGRWLVLFNNDTEVARGWLLAMLACAESAEDVGVVTPKFVYPDGSLNEAGGIVWRDGTGANYGRGDLPDRFQYEYRRETDYGSAAALMVSTELWRAAGGFDERYVPMYYEDTDLCFEARRRGLRVLYEPKAQVTHIEGATAGTDIESGHKRHQERNRSKFVAKWRRQLESQLHATPTNLRVAADRHEGPRVLVADFRVPTWNHDSGSLRMLGIVQALIGRGAHVTLMPDNFAPLQPYTHALQEMGVEVLYGALDVRAELATIGPRLSAAILSRPHVASRWLDMVREFAPAATVAYDTVDLHWLREHRRDAPEGMASADTNGIPPSLGAKAEALRQIELAMIRATDATLVVTDCERAQVQLDVPDANVLVVPNVHDIEPFVTPPDERSGIVFVGGFEHPPNTGAAVRLVNEVMPAVWRELGEVRVTIVGAHAPREVQELASPLVEVTGWIEDLKPVLDGAKLMVAPLRYGAGLKGKVTQALAAGLPVVTTSIGAEGIEHPEECILIADDSEGLAAHTIRAYRDEELWRSISRAGQTFIAEHCSSEVLADRLGQLLDIAREPVGEGAKG